MTEFLVIFGYVGLFLTVILPFLLYLYKDVTDLVVEIFEAFKDGRLTNEEIETIEGRANTLNRRLLNFRRD